MKTLSTSPLNTADYTPYAVEPFVFLVAGPNGMYTVHLLADTCECEISQVRPNEVCKHRVHIEAIVKAQIARNEATTADGFHPEGDAIRARENERLQEALEKCYRCGVLARPMAKSVPVPAPAVQTAPDCSFDIWAKGSIFGNWQRVQSNIRTRELAESFERKIYSRMTKYVATEVRVAKAWGIAA